MRLIIHISLLLFTVSLLPAQQNNGDDLIIKIATLGPGDEVYTWFGHNGLIIENTKTGQSKFYNYGLFSFKNENFFANFILGRMLYSSGAFPTANGIADYINRNSDVVLYTLDLPSEKRREVQKYAETSILPENRDYYYHMFKDNCSTRIRDIIDIATGGQFREQLGEKQGRYTFRQHARRHIWFSPFWDWTLNFLMGGGIDRPITVWDEMYLPLEVAKQITDFSYKDANGLPHKLVANVETVYRSHDRPPVLDVPRRQWPAALALGILVSLLIGFLSFLRQKRPALSRITLGICHSAIGLFFGLFGLLLLFLNLFTNHDYTFHNANLLFCNPFLLFAVPLGIRYATSGDNKKQRYAEIALRIIWFITVIGIFISLFIKQENAAARLLVLPVAITFSLAPVILIKLKA